MKENLSWVKLYRKLNNSAFKKKPLTIALFIHLLLNVNTEAKKIIWNDEEVIILPGQLITGRKTLSEDTGITQQSIRTSLKILKSTSTITIRAYTKFSIITLNNWNQYQQSTNKSTNNQPTTNQQLTTTKEYKNIRNKEEESKEKFLKLTDQDTKEVASKYQVTVAFVEKIKDQLENYCESIEWNVPYKNFKATLKMWVSRKLDEAPKSVRLKELRPDQIEDIRKNDKLSVYKKAGYDVSVLTMK